MWDCRGQVALKIWVLTRQEACEPRQVRKEATVSRSFWVPSGSPGRSRLAGGKPGDAVRQGVHDHSFKGNPVKVHGHPPETQAKEA